MSITKEKAWIIFRADKLGHEEAAGAFQSMTKEEFEAYESYAEEFDFEIAKIGVEAQNEAATITSLDDDISYLQSKKAWAMNADDYSLLVGKFKGSKFEALHLSAMFGVPNNELLLELVKP